MPFNNMNRGAAQAPSQRGYNPYFSSQRQAPQQQTPPPRRQTPPMPRQPAPRQPPPQQPAPRQPMPRQPMPQQQPAPPNQPAEQPKPPIDPELLKMLQDAAAKEDAEIAKKKGIEQARDYASLLEKLSIFAQNEKNGAAFYASLSAIAPTERHAILLAEIGKLCLINSEKYCEIYEKIKGEKLAVVEREIYKSTDFGAGINIALNEEAAYLSEMAAVYESVKDDAAARRINALVLRKISDLQLLATMRGLHAKA